MKYTMEVPGDGPHLCIDEITGRPLMSSIPQLERDANELNVHMLSEGDVSVNDFYNLIGLPTLGFFEDFGWNSRDPIRLHFDAKLMDDGQPAIVFSFRTPPKLDFMARM